MKIKILCVLIGLCCVCYFAVMIREMTATPYQLELKKFFRASLEKNFGNP